MALKQYYGLSFFWQTFSISYTESASVLSEMDADVHFMDARYAVTLYGPGFFEHQKTVRQQLKVQILFWNRHLHPKMDVCVRFQNIKRMFWTNTVFPHCWEMDVASIKWTSACISKIIGNNLAQSPFSSFSSYLRIR